MPGALEGIKVVDFTQHFAGPGTGMYLADQGADVLKVEPPNGGRDRQGEPFGDAFLVLNRGKRSLALDIRTPNGRQVARKLIERADVLLVAWPPGQAERLGYGYDAMRELNPRLIYASITGWGTAGALKDKLGYDRLLQAYTGLMEANDNRPTPVFLADMALPMLLSYGITLALLARERTGQGQKVESSQLDAQIAMQAIYMVFHGDLSAEPVAGYKPSTPHTYATSDGRYITLAMLTKEEDAALWRAVSLTRPPAGTNSPEARATLAEAFASQPLAYWQQRLDAEHVHFAAVLSRAEFIRQPQAWDNGMLLAQDHPHAGHLSMMGVPVRLSATSGVAGQPAPAFGQHTREVLRELGYDDFAINNLYEEGTVA